MTANLQPVAVPEAIPLEELTALADKGKANPGEVKTPKCRTVWAGRRFTHYNYVRNLDAHVVDEPPQLLGDDTAPNPTEALLAALGTCVSVGVQANAVHRGWTVNAIEVALEGDINITSVWGTGDIPDGKPVGLQDVRIAVTVDIDGGTPEEIDDMLAHAARWSPVLNSIKNPVNVQIARA